MDSTEITWHMAGTRFRPAGSHTQTQQREEATVRGKLQPQALDWGSTHMPGVNVLAVYASLSPEKSYFTVTFLDIFKYNEHLKMSSWLCNNLNLTYSSNCFPPCTYLLETGVKDAMEQWGVGLYTILRFCIIVRLVTEPINISDNQNRFKLSWAITIQLRQNIEIPILEFTMDNDNFKSLVFWLKKLEKSNSLPVL